MKNSEPEILREGFICRHEHFCKLCNQNITKGSRIYPIRPTPQPTRVNTETAGNEKIKINSNKADRDWVHFACAEEKGVIDDLSQRPVCKHWARRGKCLFRETCFFAHPEDAKCTLKPKRTWAGRRVAVRNDGRSNEFRRFIVRTYGLEKLSIGSGILDVAGGKGELSFLFENLNGINCTCIEPRSLRLRKFVRRFKYGMFHRTRIVSGRYVTRDYRQGTRICKQIRMCLYSSIIKALVQDDYDKLHHLISNSLEESKDLAWTSKGLHEHEHDEPIEFSEKEEEDDDYDTNNITKIKRQEQKINIKSFENGVREKGKIPTVASEFLPVVKDKHSEKQFAADTDVNISIKNERENKAAVSELEDINTIINILRNASAVVGMHADQATGAIVDLALALNVPFAVVPCCVYAKLFPERRLKDGTEVTDYNTLIQYLVEKDPENIRVTTLDFEGKNKVVYSLPKRNHSSKQA